MASYIEYELQDGNTVLIETDEPQGGLVQASLIDGLAVKKATQKFEQSLAGVKSTAIALHQQLHDLGPDEFEVKFGLKVAGEAGNFAVGKVGVEANYEVTLKWKNEQTEE